MVVSTFIQVNLIGPAMERRRYRRIPAQRQWVAMNGYEGPLLVISRRGSSVCLSYVRKPESNDDVFEMDGLTMPEYVVLPYGHASRYNEWLSSQEEASLSLVDFKAAKDVKV